MTLTWYKNELHGLLIYWKNYNLKNIWNILNYKYYKKKCESIKYFDLFISHDLLEFKFTVLWKLIIQNI
jgi:hypothetical protein